MSMLRFSNSTYLYTEMTLTVLRFTSRFHYNKISIGTSFVAYWAGQIVDILMALNFLTVEKSWERSSALPLHFGVLAIEK